MRDLFYAELKNCSKEIRKIEEYATQEEILKGHRNVLAIVEELIYLNRLGRKEGLLALEEESYHMDDSSHKYIKTMLMLIVDGTDPELVEEICLMKYMTAGFKAYDALVYLMQLIGVLSMQAGEHPRIMEERLLAMVPEKVNDMFSQKREEEAKSYFEQKIDDVDMSKVEKLYEGILNTEIVELGYPELEKLDYLLKVITDRSLQRALREIDNADLELAMKGLSGESRHRVFVNMSKRLCVMVAEDMENMGRGRKCDIGDAAKKIYSIFMRLMDRYEICPEESDEVYAMYEEYKKGSDNEGDGEEKNKIETLSLEDVLKVFNNN